MLECALSELADEDFAAMPCNVDVFVAKIAYNMRGREGRLPLCRQISRNLEEFRQATIAQVLYFSVKDVERLANDPPPAHSLANSAPPKPGEDSRRDACISAITLASHMADYSKLLGVLPEYRDIVLEQCSLLVNAWLVGALLRFVPRVWLATIANFQAVGFQEEPDLS